MRRVEPESPAMFNPFPGMNPYLERRGDEWKDFHTQFIVAIRQALVPSLGDRYKARTEQMLFVHEPPAARRSAGAADVGAALTARRRRSGDVGVALAEAPAKVAAPAVMRFAEPIAFERHRYVSVRTEGGDRIVTVIEVLSPSNKRKASDRAQYLAKRGRLMRAGVHFVQVDLLRAGPRLLPAEPPPCAYCVTLVRSDRYPTAEVWPVGLRDRLPMIPIPLLSPDPDVRLDLQAVLDKTYDAAGYGPSLYRRPPDPPLEGDDADWAAGRLAAVA